MCSSDLSLSFKNLSDLLKALKKLDTHKKVKVIILEGAGISKTLLLDNLKSTKNRFVVFSLNISIVNALSSLHPYPPQNGLYAFGVDSAKA